MVTKNVWMALLIFQTKQFQYVYVINETLFMKYPVLKQLFNLIKKYYNVLNQLFEFQHL